MNIHLTHLHTVQLALYRRGGVMSNTNLALDYIPVTNKGNENVIEVNFAGRKVSSERSRNRKGEEDDYEILIVSKRRSNWISNIFFILAAIETAAIGESFLLDETWRTFFVGVGLAALFICLGLVVMAIDNYLRNKKRRH